MKLHGKEPIQNFTGSACPALKSKAQGSAERLKPISSNQLIGLETSMSMSVAARGGFRRKRCSSTTRHGRELRVLPRCFATGCMFTRLASSICEQEREGFGNFVAGQIGRFCQWGSLRLRLFWLSRRRFGCAWLIGLVFRLTICLGWKLSVVKWDLCLPLSGCS